ncbi:MAG: hypothetical protein LC750_16600, partial [Actinobacteria bacterium]|nr:hypothetical protein [Actinomycetota bacterium]
MPARDMRRRNLMRVLALLLVSVFFVPTASHAAPGADSCSAGPSKAEAAPLGATGSCAGEDEGAYDWWYFDLTAPASIGIFFSTGGLKATLTNPA